MSNKNKEGYLDPTASKAIREADKVNDRIDWFIWTVKTLAGLVDLEVVGRIRVKDKRTRKEYF